MNTDFKPEHPDKVNRNIYLGKFCGDFVSLKRVSLSKLKDAWLSAIGREFIPHIMFKGGIRQLNTDECRLLCRLMGVERY